MESIEEAVDRFYKALNAMFIGDLAPMKEVWSHKDDVSYLGPQGDILLGWSNVLKAFEAQAKMVLGGKVLPEKIHIFSQGEIAMTQNYEIGSNKLEGREIEVKIRAMNLFRKEDNCWKMISHQTDLLPHL